MATFLVAAQAFAQQKTVTGRVTSEIGAPLQGVSVVISGTSVGTLTNSDISRYKQFHKGLMQLEEEGAVQVFHAEDSHRREPILAAVGELQFDVVLARLEEEYGVKARIDRLPFTCARWVKADSSALDQMSLSRHATRRCRDRQERPVILFSSIWDIEYCQKENPDITFAEIS